MWIWRLYQWMRILRLCMLCSHKSRRCQRVGDGGLLSNAFLSLLEVSMNVLVDLLFLQV